MNPPIPRTDPFRRLPVFCLAIAALTVRARRTWMVFVMVPLFANGSLFVMPWLASGLIEG